MLSSNKLALTCLAVVLAASVFFGRSAIAGQPSHKNSHNHQNHNHGNKFSRNHHNHHNHHHNHFHHGPVFVPTRHVQVQYCVMVRQPSRYSDWNFHQVKCFGSAHEAEFFAATLRSRSGGDHGFMVRIDRKQW